MSDFAAWHFYNPTRIEFGLRFPDDLATHLASVPTLLVTSPGWRRRGIAGQVVELLGGHGIDEHRVLDIATANPSFEDLRAAANALAGFQPQAIIAIGGGSVMDLAKILSYVFAKDSPGVEEMLDQLVRGQPLPERDNVPLTACPTTAGTGSEVTPFATLWDTRNKKKYSVATHNLYPERALLFPELTASMPWEVTLSTGLDALSQALESVWNKRYTYLTAAVAQCSVQLIFDALPALKAAPADLGARAKMLEASVLAGLCISQTRTAMAHAMSYPLTAHYGTPHGIACSFTLPDLWDYNLGADDGRMHRLCSALGVAPEAFSQRLAEFLESLDFKAEFVKTIDSLDSVLRLSGEMFTPGRSDNNLRSFDDDSLRVLIERAVYRWR